MSYETFLGETGTHGGILDVFSGKILYPLGTTGTFSEDTVGPVAIEGICVVAWSFTGVAEACLLKVWPLL